MPHETIFPANTETVVIGGGIVGVSTALALAQKSIPVVLCEKGRIAGEQSSRNWGWTRVMGRDLAEIPLGIESLRLWAGMDRMVAGNTGWRRCGIVYLCETERELAAQDHWLTLAREFQIDSRRLTPSETAHVLPGLANRFAGAIHTPGDGRAEPAQATQAIATAAERAGATVLTECAVRGVDQTGGRVTGVITERGRIACNQVVLAGGAWSRLLAGNTGIDLPSLLLLGSVMRTEPLSGLPETSAAGDRFAFRKRADGGYTIARRNGSISDITPDSFRQLRRFLPASIRGWRELRLRLGPRFLEEWRMKRRWTMDEVTPFEQIRVLDPTPSEAVLSEARAALIQAFPGFSAMREAERWGGMIDATPDTVPVISAVAKLPGLYIAAGFSGHGFGIGPGAGRLMADIVAGDTPIVDPSPYRIDRFH